MRTSLASLCLLVGCAGSTDTANQREGDLVGNGGQSTQPDDDTGGESGPGQEGENTDDDTANDDLADDTAPGDDDTASDVDDDTTDGDTADDTDDDADDDDLSDDDAADDDLSDDTSQPDDDTADDDTTDDDAADDDLSDDTSQPDDDVDDSLCGSDTWQEPPAACEGQCGDGQVSNCEVCTQTGVPGTAQRQRIALLPLPIDECYEVSEECDGEIAGASSCEDRGFVGGSLRCGDNCRFDTRDCLSCGTDARIVDCTDTISDANGHRSVALATSESRIAVASSSDSEGTRFDVFDGNLERIAAGSCLGPAVNHLALASLPDGWLLGYQDQLLLLDEDGRERDRRTIDGMRLPLLASRTSTSPFLVWVDTDGNVWGRLLDQQGAEVWTTFITSGPIGWEYGSVVATADGFLVAQRLNGSGVQIFHVGEAMGDVTTGTPPGGESTEYPQLASNGTSARVVWSDFSGDLGFYWAPLDAYGEPTGSPVRLEIAPNFMNRSPIQMVEQDTVILLGGYTGTTGYGHQLDVRRIGPDADTVYDDYRLQIDPDPVATPQLAPFGNTMIAAWVTQGALTRVGLAKLAP